MGETVCLASTYIRDAERWTSPGHRLAMFFLAAFALGCASYNDKLGEPPASPLRPPPIVETHLATLQEIKRVGALPQALRDGYFGGAGGDKKVAADWALANPGAAWRSTDIVTNPKLPYRRLVFAACDSTVCLLHYQLGGYASSERIIALVRTAKAYRVVWRVVGFQAIGSLRVFESRVRQKTPVRFTSTQGGYRSY